MRLAIVDGQGGGIGATIIKGLRQVIGQDIEILALGTNSTATSRMMKAGANRGATGENAIVTTCKKVDLIIGPISIIMANSMMGELTPAMASAISSSEARKILLPLSQENVILVGASGEPLPHLVQEAIGRIKEMWENV
ncbi:MAG: DUF3842 family protein [Deltaproteobacteria bacterium]|mgnify:CR=1 FL=1|nr:DUF3842 family protein [Deltaproteobacteria bacterium]MBW1927557.1 DUF3842 family protein [Deltaproteobacteria bacterium]MBW2026517.1 DUF3842 family protein [Deltaproteobacteria bacterium]MBW2124808.1 DUF3842 family protein [Deltaproteobacteria bacterium]RLB22496.1 MAG: hypothetical protein DRG76_06580 [Deltaproteobacteria bacterium]